MKRYLCVRFPAFPPNPMPPPRKKEGKPVFQRVVVSARSILGHTGSNSGVTPFKSTVPKLLSSGTVNYHCLSASSFKFKMICCLMLQLNWKEKLGGNIDARGGCKRCRSWKQVKRKWQMPTHTQLWHRTLTSSFKTRFQLLEPHGFPALKAQDLLRKCRFLLSPQQARLLLFREVPAGTCTSLTAVHLFNRKNIRADVLDGL